MRREPDYDLILRLTEISGHSSRSACLSLAVHADPTASSLPAKGYAVAAAERALADHLKRTCARAVVEPGMHRDGGALVMRFPGTRA